MATPAIDLIALFGQHRAAQIIAAERNDLTTTTRGPPPHDCWLSSRALTAEGYARRSLLINAAITADAQGVPRPTPAYKTVYLHRLAYIARTGQNFGADMQASHLCDNANCFNPQHIVSETGQANHDRWACRGQILCPHHNWRLVTSFCSHNPNCLKPQNGAAQFFCCGLMHGDESSSGHSQSGPTTSTDSSQEDDSSQSQSNDQILGGDYSDLPPSSLQQGEITDSDDDESDEAGDANPQVDVVAPVSSRSEIPDSDDPDGINASLALTSSDDNRTPRLPGRRLSPSPSSCSPPPAKRRKVEVGEGSSSEYHPPDTTGSSSQ